MIDPRRWILKRPGLWIPVFFLSLFHTMASCQMQVQDASSASLGGCFVTGRGFSCTRQNQAGLGFIERSSLSIQHDRPYLLGELGNSALTGQFVTGTGALGLNLSTRGLPGFRQSSLWLSYGLKIHAGMSAGAGIHLWNSSIPDHLIHAPGISFSLGLQVLISEQWKLGACLSHPAGWSSLPGLPAMNQLVLAAGAGYSFFKSGHIYTELHIQPEQGLILCNGLEWNLSQVSTLRTGISNRPFTFSWGISVKFTRWIAEFSFQYRTDSGLCPFSSLTHAW